MLIYPHLIVLGVLVNRKHILCILDVDISTVHSFPSVLLFVFLVLFCTNEAGVLRA